ncbi:MAG TPA: 4-(cytidine 5'-diphospho)-2-C-methyl-D-erythritol kinase [Longimicrobiales bacterium]|nr:4-(cytidine 5'-diphospho)-2-C-methyl-D-erythritol kinase [Longimicrobiales bacterium]
MSPGTGRTLRIDAPAKVNLSLRVLERMPDGFHRLETLFQAVDLRDALTVSTVPGDDVALDTAGAEVGPPEENLVVRAVRAFREATGTATGVRIRLMKRIPAGAGLGGGSSDAGAALRLLDHLHGDPLGRDARQELGSGLGADVAFFAGEAGYALGEGRGERLRGLPPLARRTLLLGLPPVHVPTGPTYGALARHRAGSGPPPPILEGTAPRDWEAVAACAVNDFEAVVPGAHPAVAAALGALRASGSPLSLLSGSGGAVFGLPWSDDPEVCLRELREGTPEVRWVAAATLDRLPEPWEVDRGGETG